MGAHFSDGVKEDSKEGQLKMIKDALEERNDSNNSNEETYALEQEKLKFRSSII